MLYLVLKGPILSITAALSQSKNQIKPIPEKLPFGLITVTRASPPTHRVFCTLYIHDTVSNKD